MEMTRERVDKWIEAVEKAEYIGSGMLWDGYNARQTPVCTMGIILESEGMTRDKFFSPENKILNKDERYNGIPYDIVQEIESVNDLSEIGRKPRVLATLKSIRNVLPT